MPVTESPFLSAVNVTGNFYVGINGHMASEGEKMPPYNIGNYRIKIGIKENLTQSH